MQMLLLLVTGSVVKPHPGLTMTWWKVTTVAAPADWHYVTPVTVQRRQVRSGPTTHRRHNPQSVYFKETITHGILLQFKRLHFTEVYRDTLLFAVRKHLLSKHLDFLFHFLKKH